MQFVESVKRGMKTKEIKKTKTTNWTNEVKPQTANQSKIEAICDQKVGKFIFMLEFSIFIEDQKRNRKRTETS